MQDMKKLTGNDTNGTNISLPRNMDINGPYTTWNLPYITLSNFDLLFGTSSLTQRSTWMAANTNYDPKILKGSNDFLNGKALWSPTTPIATECILQLSANAYESFVKNGISTEVMRGSWTNRDPASWQPSVSDNGTSDPQSLAWAKERGNILFDDLSYRTDLKLRSVPSKCCAAKPKRNAEHY
ncbi:hypothetical protein P154DRAFT_540258 [Amniculicola lignicola CBS 123094]|uniref:Uncharacterized protein n=1 Tax=Amniculicola lignicola CBS 123094 TaxID=1392246 RepID=A0A6A5W7J0_9PLEO|nr:hypothetical protein P154DRAFT_540258 [Amniculicola lignicola CBS 123094]